MHATASNLLHMTYPTRLSVTLPAKNVNPAVVMVGTICQIATVLLYFRHATELHLLPPCGCTGGYVTDSTESKGK